MYISFLCYNHQFLLSETDGFQRSKIILSEIRLSVLVVASSRSVPLPETNWEWLVEFAYC